MNERRKGESVEGMAERRRTQGLDLTVSDTVTRPFHSYTSLFPSLISSSPLMPSTSRSH